MKIAYFVTCLRVKKSRKTSPIYTNSTLNGFTSFPRFNLFICLRCFSFRTDKRNHKTIKKESLDLTHVHVPRRPPTILSTALCLSVCVCGVATRT